MFLMQNSSQLMRTIKLMYSCLIFVLLCVDVLFISAKYFKYTTDTDVTPIYPVKLMIPSISLCFPIKSFLEVERNQNDSTVNEFPFLGMKVKDIFNQVPYANETIESCEYRDFDQDILVSVQDSVNCSQVFAFSRYIMQGFVCYRYSPRQSIEYSYHTLVNSIYAPRVLYHLTFRGPLSSKQVMYPVVHLNDYPREDRVYNQEKFIDLHSMHHVSYGEYESVGLPAPYDSRCSPVTPMTCYQNCVDDYYRKYDFISDTSLVPEDSSSVNLFYPPQDAELGEVMRLRSSCFTKCNRQGCYFRLTDTRTAATYPSDADMVLAIETIDTPTMKVIYDANFKFFDYFTQVATLTGIWLGISVISVSALFQSNGYRNMTEAYRRIEFYTTFVMKMHSVVKRKRIRMTMKHNHSNTSRRSRTLAVAHFIIFRCFCKLLVILLFSWQVLNVMTTYFLYRTTIRFDYDVNPSLISPSVSLCYTNEDIFNVSVSGMVTENNYDQVFRAIDSAFNHTLEQIFDELDIKDALDACTFRNWTDRLHRFISFNQSECFEKINVIKFFTNKELCFGMIPRVRFLPYHVSDVRLSVEDPGTVYTITSGSKMQYAKKVHVYLYFGDGPPQAASKYITFYRKKQHRIIRLSNLLYSINLLTPPYDTRCSKIGRKACFEACISKHLSTIDRVSYSVRMNKPIPLKVLTYTDMTDERVYNLTRDAEETCLTSCDVENCNYNFTTTITDGDIYFNASDSVSRVRYAALTVAFPNSKIRTEPVQVLYDLMYQTLCCFSFWLGFSFSALNPASLIAGRKAKEANEYLNERLNHLKQILKSINVETYKPLRCRLRPEWNRFRRKVTLIYILSLIGCCIHSWYSFVIYFQYSALVDIHQKADTDTNMFPLICLDTAELLIRTLNESESKLKLLSDPMFKAQLLNRTISSILADTPQGEEMIQSCQYWGTHARQGKVSQMEIVTDRILFETRNKSICNQVYKVSQFVVNNYMCYTVAPRNYTGWTTRKMSNALNDGKTYVKITVKSSFMTRRFSIMINRLHYLPWTSSMWAPNMQHVPEYNRYHISYIRYVQSLLPSPYPLEGFTPFLFDRCNNACINSKFDLHNVTLSRRFSENSHLKFMTLAHRKGAIMPKLIKSVVDFCETKCIVYNDHRKEDKVKTVTIFVPTVRALSVRKSKYDEIAFLLRGTNNPVISVYFTLEISLLNQILNFGSVIGIWFGLSMMDLTGGRRDETDFMRDSYGIDTQVHQLERVLTRGVS